MPETPKERTDRQLGELLEELRVTMPGAQVLLAFLLTVPFATRFGRTTDFQRALLFACVLVTAAGVLLLMAPSVYHRIRWNRGGKSDVIAVGHKLFLAGTLCLALGMATAVFLVADVLFGIVAALFTLPVTAGIVVATWYVLPLRHARDPQIRESD
jgi:hypothetical protein